MRRPLWIAAAVALIASSARAEASNWCLWTLLYDAHAVATRCESALSSDAEARYQRLRQVTEATLTRDAPLHAGVTADSMQQEIAKYVASHQAAKLDPAHCQDADAKSVVKIFDTLTSPETMAKIEAGLAKPRDPYDGDCI